MGIKNLSNELLIKAFVKANKLQLDEDFLLLLLNEIVRRNLKVDKL